MIVIIQWCQCRRIGNITPVQCCFEGWKRLVIHDSRNSLDKLRLQLCFWILLESYLVDTSLHLSYPMVIRSVRNSLGCSSDSDDETTRLCLFTKPIQKAFWYRDEKKTLLIIDERMRKIPSSFPPHPRVYVVPWYITSNAILLFSVVTKKRNKQQPKTTPTNPNKNKTWSNEFFFQSWLLLLWWVIHFIPVCGGEYHHHKCYFQHDHRNKK